MVAHQKNNAQKVDFAINEGFWGIEVDVHQIGNEFKLYHDSNDSDKEHNYKLNDFLDICKKKGITAVLDLKAIYDYDVLISLVKEKGTQNNTIYQTSSSVAKKLHNNDNNTRIWVLISDSYKDIDTDKINELTDVKDYIEGINMKAKNVDEKDIKAIHDLGLTICSFSYTSKMYSNASAETLKSWGTNYLMANNIDE